MPGASGLRPKSTRGVRQPADSQDVAGLTTDPTRGIQPASQEADVAIDEPMGGDTSLVNRDSPLPGSSKNKGLGKKTGKSQVQPRAQSERRVLDHSDKESSDDSSASTPPSSPEYRTRIGREPVGASGAAGAVMAGEAAPKGRALPKRRSRTG
jgi:hypothetical protein